MDVLLCSANYKVNFYLVTDRRTYKDRRDVWAAEKKAAELALERPKAKIRHNTPPPEENLVRKSKPAAASSGGQDEDLVSDWRSRNLSLSLVMIILCFSLLHRLLTKKQHQQKKNPLLPKKRKKKKNKPVKQSTAKPSYHFNLFSLHYIPFFNIK